MYTTIQKLGVGKIFKRFWTSLLLHLFDQKYSKNCNIMKYSNMFIYILGKICIYQRTYSLLK